MKVGDKVLVTMNSGSFKMKDAEGKIDYIDNLFQSIFPPVQVLLNEPYDDSGHRLIRCYPKEVKILKGGTVNGH